MIFIREFGEPNNCDTCGSLWPEIVWDNEGFYALATFGCFGGIGEEVRTLAHLKEFDEKHREVLLNVFENYGDWLQEVECVLRGMNGA